MTQQIIEKTFWVSVCDGFRTKSRINVFIGCQKPSLNSSPATVDVWPVQQKPNVFGLHANTAIGYAAKFARSLWASLQNLLPETDNVAGIPKGTDLSRIAHGVTELLVEMEKAAKAAEKAAAEKAQQAEAEEGEVVKDQQPPPQLLKKRKKRRKKKRLQQREPTPPIVTDVMLVGGEGQNEEEEEEDYEEAEEAEEHEEAEEGEEAEEEEEVERREDEGNEEEEADADEDEEEWQLDDEETETEESSMTTPMDDSEEVSVFLSCLHYIILEPIGRRKRRSVSNYHYNKHRNR